MVDPVRVRFAPAPSGDLHVGNVRTALYNWAFARRHRDVRHRGVFVLRIEDTDRSRATEAAYQAALDVLRWLGLDWDEGPGRGGPHAPYRQSERLELYAEALRRLVAQGDAYPCYCTPAELADRREQSRRAGRPPGYDGHCRSLTARQLTDYEAAGRRPVLRFRMPAGVTRVQDMVRGEVSFDHASVADFTLARSDGHPLYMLAATVDDVSMGITHIIRGEDLISAVPRQMAVYAALGVAAGRAPTFGHLPLITGADGKPLSKRHGEVSIAYYRDAGFLPEAMVNYLALLGWSLGGDREDFTLEEMARAFTIERVNRNPARFDMRKLEAINGDKIRALTAEDFVGRITPFLQTGGLVGHPPTSEELRVLAGAAPLVQERIARLTEAPEMLAFLLVDERHFSVDPEAAARSLTDDSRRTLDAALSVLQGVGDWSSDAIQASLRAALVDGLGLKPKHAFGPVRVAVTGRRVSPPLFESMELLGQERSVSRLAGALDALVAPSS